jgi:hypothetical protein
MDATVKKQWVDALRSGKYRQGFGALRKGLGLDNDQYCCLGVLCEVAGLSSNRPLGDDAYIYAFEKDKGLLTSYNCSNTCLPGTLAEKLELMRVPTVHIDGFDVSLVTLNDDRKMSFKQIADIIEAQL